MTPDDERPPMIRELDFSEFHPLDHWPGCGYCRSLPGGVRNHLALAWAYKWPDLLARRTRCRVGWHRWVRGWRGEVPLMLCAFCWVPRPSGDDDPSGDGREDDSEREGDCGEDSHGERRGGFG